MDKTIIIVSYFSGITIGFLIINFIINLYNRKQDRTRYSHLFNGKKSITIYTDGKYQNLQQVWESVLKYNYYPKGKGKISRLLNPCRKCIVKPMCDKHATCQIYQEWYFKQRFCKHRWKVSSVLMRLPTGLSHECKICGKIK